MEDNKKQTFFIIVGAVLIILIGGYASNSIPAKAGSGAFGLSTSQSNPENPFGGPIGTSTLRHMTPGTGTTTLTLNTTGTDQLNFNILMQASSTLTDLRWRIEFSHSTSSVAAEQLWFPEEASVNELATTTVQTRISREYQWVFASTTPHRIGTSTAMNSTFDQNTVSARSFRIKDIAARWTRIIFYLPTGSSVNAAAANSDVTTTALGSLPGATSTNAAIYVHAIQKEPL